MTPHALSLGPVVCAELMGTMRGSHPISTRQHRNITNARPQTHSPVTLAPARYIARDLSQFGETYR